MHILIQLAFVVFLIQLNFLASTLVYIDATRKQIGYIKGQKLSLPAGFWGFLTILPFFGLFTMITYIFKRQKLIRRAELNPVQVGIIQRVFVSVVLFVLGFFITILVF